MSNQQQTQSSRWQNVFGGVPLSATALHTQNQGFTNPHGATSTASQQPPLSSTSPYNVKPQIAGTNGASYMQGATSPPFGYDQSSSTEYPYNQQDQQQNPPYNQSGSHPASPFSESYAIHSSKPPISVMTDGTSMPPSSMYPNYGEQSSSDATLAFLGLAAAGGSAATFDPTSIIYDENTGGYATPSYAGSYADDSSFEDREGGRSHSPFSSRPASVRGFSRSPDTRQQENNQQPIFAQNGADLFAFRDANNKQQQGVHSDWDSASSVGGPNDDALSRSSPAAGHLNSSPEMGQRIYNPEGNGLEMAVERMFAPVPSPKLFPPSPPVRDDTLRASSSPPIQEQGNPPPPALPAFTASPNHSPRLVAQLSNSANVPVLNNVPTFARLSPSPSPASAAFGQRSQYEQQQDTQPPLRSPPLPHGLAYSSASNDQARTSSLAPLAIPLKPDLTLTTATPTARPRTALTARQDSTQAALDTVFSTFFDKANKANRTDSTDSMPSTMLPPEAAQALYNIPAHDLTLNLGSAPFRRPSRQRSMSDSYMTSPVSFDPSSSFHLAFDSITNQVGHLPTGAIDPRQLDSHSPLPPRIASPAMLGSQALRSGSAGGIDGDDAREVDGEDMLLANRDSQSGPAARRRSIATSNTPYEPNIAVPESQISPSGQVFLIPPSPASMRRSRSSASQPGGGGGGHRRNAQSEDFRNSSAFTPRTAQYMNLNLHTPSDLRIPEMPRMDSDPYAHHQQQQQNQQYLPTSYGQSQHPYQDHNLPPMPSATPGGSFLDDSSSIYGLPPLPDSQYLDLGMQGPSSNYGGYENPLLDANGYMIAPGGGGSLMPSGYPGYTPGPDLGFDLQGPYSQYGSMGGGGGGPGQIMYAPLEEDNLSVNLDPASMANRGRRRSSVRSDMSGHSGLSGAGSEVTFESKTTEATKQAARRRRKDPNAAKFSCEYCGETFTRAYNLKGHIRSHEGSKPFGCSTCGKGFARRHDLKRHELLHTGEKKYICEACKTPFVRLDALQRHHKSENGAACVAQIAEMSEMQGIDMSTYAGVDMSEFTKGVQL